MLLISIIKGRRVRQDYLDDIKKFGENDHYETTF